MFLERFWAHWHINEQKVTPYSVCGNVTQKYYLLITAVMVYINRTQE